MSKDLSLANLYKDLGYIIHQTEAHQFLFSIFPPKKGAWLFEPGCGSGKFGISYAMQGCNVVMIDIDEQVVDYAQRLRNAIRSLMGDKANLPIDHCLIGQGDLFRNYRAEGADGYDFVYNEGFSQHWTDEEHRQGAINKMVEAAKVGGIVCVMGNNGLRKEEQEADQYFEFQYEGMPPHRKCFKPDELVMRLEKAGLHDVQVAAVSRLVPIEVSYLIAGWGIK